VSAFSASRRAEVAARAGHRCEYCHLPTRGQVATFPIDHIIPQSAGAGHDPDYLALSCPHCNAHKWTAIEAIDPATRLPTPLFHPRSDGWGTHFEWAGQGVLLGKTSIGLATIAELGMNDAAMIELRRLLAELALFPEAG
jgi:hypothetical protein